MGWWLTGRDEKAVADRVMLSFIGLMLLGLASQAQSFHPGTICLNPAPRALEGPAALAPVHVFREVKDPSTGSHWLILSDRVHPAGPGRMVLASQVSRSDTAAQAEEVRPVVAVHLGDRVAVEEHTRVAEAYLEAVALEPAVAGASFHVRLKIGGEVVRVVAIEPGRAALMPASGMPSSEAQR